LEACVNAKITDCGTNKKNVKESIESALCKINIIKSKISELKSRVPDIINLIKEVKNEMD